MYTIRIIQRSIFFLLALFALTACPFIDTGGTIRILNDLDNGYGPIVIVTIDADCNNGWSGDKDVNIPVDGSKTFDVESGSYDIRACKNFQGTIIDCRVWYNEPFAFDNTETYKYSMPEGYISFERNSCSGLKPEDKDKDKDNDLDLDLDRL